MPESLNAAPQATQEGNPAPRFHPPSWKRFSRHRTGKTPTARPSPSPRQTLVLLAALIFGVELLIMIALHLLPELGPAMSIFVDASLLVLILAPCLYYWVYKSLADGDASLSASEQRYARTIETLTQGIYTTDERGVFSSVNQAMCDIYGFDRIELLGMPAWELAVPELREETRSRFVKMIDEKKFQPVEVECRRKDGRRIVTEVRVSGHMGDGVIYGLVIDITERKRAEEALRLSHESVAAIGRSAFDAVVMLDEKGFPTVWNPAAEAMFGLTEAQALGQNIHAIICPPQYFEKHKEGFERFRHSGSGPFVGHVVALTARRSSGEEFPIEMSISAVRQGDAWTAIAVIRDVGAQRQSEEARLRTFVQHAYDVVAVLDREGRIIFESPAVESVLGYAAFERIGRNIFEYIHPEDAERVRASIRRLLEGQSAAERLERRARHKNGDWRYLESMGVILPEPLSGIHDGFQIVINYRDVTERREAAEKLAKTNAELIAANEKLESLDRQKREFLAAVAHELRTPIAVALGALESLRSGKTGKLLEAQGRMLEMVHRNTARLNRLFENLLDLVRGDKGQFRINPGRVDLREVVLQAAESFRAIAEPAGRVIRTNVPEANLPVHADRDRLDQILGNLLDNAIRYSHREIEVGLEEKAETFVLRVTDDGPGVGNHHLPRLFERFYRVERATPKDHIGLGLSLVRTIAEAHGGRAYAVTPASGLGICFVVELPRMEIRGNGK